MDLLKVTPNIPSRFTSTKRHCAVVAYVPVGSEASGLPPWHLLPPPPGQPFTSSPEVSRISMWICGPRHNNSCIPGARTTVNKTSTLMNYNRVYCSILVPMFWQLCTWRDWSQGIQLPSTQFGEKSTWLTLGAAHKPSMRKFVCLTMVKLKISSLIMYSSA